MASVNDEVTELSETLNQIPWSSTFTFDSSDKQLHHQTAYNKAIATALFQKGWRTQPLLNNTPRLIGDFAKGLVFGEVQFGNSATLYRDFYKFQFGLQNGLLSLAVLIVPHNEHQFFPTRKTSVTNMANFGLALKFFTVLPISVPTIIFGLLADNEAVHQEL
jgi:hypothetical protein